jgi:hypothetical protein
MRSALLHELQLIALLSTLKHIYWAALFVHTYRIKVSAGINGGDTSGATNINADENDIPDAEIVKDSTQSNYEHAGTTDKKVSNFTYLKYSTCSTE